MAAGAEMPEANFTPNLLSEGVKHSPGTVGEGPAPCRALFRIGRHAAILRIASETVDGPVDLCPKTLAWHQPGCSAPPLSGLEVKGSLKEWFLPNFPLRKTRRTGAAETPRQRLSPRLVRVLRKNPGSVGPVARARRMAKPRMWGADDYRQCRKAALATCASG